MRCFDSRYVLGRIASAPLILLAFGSVTPVAAQMVGPQSVRIVQPGAHVVTIPPGASDIRLHCWGAGGGGGRSQPPHGGGGGGGGAYQQVTIPAGPLTLDVQVGQAGGAGVDGMATRVSANGIDYCAVGGGRGGSAPAGGPGGSLPQTVSGSGFSGASGHDGLLGNRTLIPFAPDLAEGGAGGDSGGVATAEGSGGAGGSGGALNRPAAAGGSPGGGGGGGNPPGIGGAGRVVLEYLATAGGNTPSPAEPADPTEPTTPDGNSGQGTPADGNDGQAADMPGSFARYGPAAADYVRSADQWESSRQWMSARIQLTEGTSLLDRVICPEGQGMVGLGQQEGYGVELLCSAFQSELWTANPNVSGHYWDRAVGPITAVRNGRWDESKPEESARCLGRELVSGQIFYLNFATRSLVDPKIHFACDTMIDRTPDIPAGSFGDGGVIDDSSPIRAMWVNVTNIASEQRCPWPYPAPIGVDIRTPNELGRQAFLICNYDPATSPVARRPDSGPSLERSVVVKPAEPSSEPAAAPGPCTTNPDRCATVAPIVAPGSRVRTKPTVSPNDNPPTPVPDVPR